MAGIKIFESLIFAFIPQETLSCKHQVMAQSPGSRMPSANLRLVSLGIRAQDSLIHATCRDLSRPCGKTESCCLFMKQLLHEVPLQLCPALLESAG